MVIKSQVFHLLRKYLGEYLYGFSKDQLEIGYLSGEFELINVNFKPKKVNQMLIQKNLPFYLKSGMIGKLRVKCNYRSFLTSPIEVFLEELLLIMGPVLVTNSDSLFEKTETLPDEDPVRMSSVHSTFMDKSSGLFDDFRSVSPGIRIRSLEKLQEKEGEGFFVKYLKGILTNLSVNIEKVHVRFEDETYAYRHPYSITLLLDKFQVATSPNEYFFSESGELQERPVQSINGIFNNESSYNKQGSIENFSIHVVSMSSMLIPSSLWEETESSSIGIFSALPAYEIRSLILQEAESLRDSQSSQVLLPLSLKFSAAISTGPPNLKLIGNIEKLSVRVSDTSAECFRNLFDYVENARIWKEIRKYRPLQKIISETREENEPEYLKMLRHEVALSWFQYCFLFLKAKFKKPLFPDLPSPEFRDSPKASEVETTEKSIFAPKTQKIAGKVSNDVKNLIKEYNTALSTDRLDKIKEKVQPFMVKPENFFPKPLENSEIDVKTGVILAEFFDEEIRSSCMTLVKDFYLMLRVTSDELTAYSTVDVISIEVKTSGKSVSVFEMGRDYLSENQNETGEKVKALELMMTYRPSQHQYLLGNPPLLNFVDVKSRIDEIRINYSHVILAEILTIVESFKTDKLFMEILDFDYMKKIEEKRSTLTWKEKFVKKSRQVMHRGVFKKVLMAKKLIRRILQWQSQMKERIKNVDNIFKPLLFDFKIQTFGVRIQLLNKFLNETAVITLPAGLSELVKTTDTTKIDLFGFGLSSKVPFKKLYKFFLKISENTKKGLKRMKNATKRISVISPLNPLNRPNN